MHKLTITCYSMTNEKRPSQNEPNNRWRILWCFNVTKRVFSVFSSRNKKDERVVFMMLVLCKKKKDIRTWPFCRCLNLWQQNWRHKFLKLIINTVNDTDKHWLSLVQWSAIVVGGGEKPADSGVPCAICQLRCGELLSHFNWEGKVRGKKRPQTLQDRQRIIYALPSTFTAVAHHQARLEDRRQNDRVKAEST